MRVRDENLRRGSVLSTLVLLALPMLLLALMLAVNSGLLAETRIALHNAADASALAAAQALVDDRLLTHDALAILGVLENARQQAQRFLDANPVPGNARPVHLARNPDNAADGDIVFGTLHRPRDQQFVLASPRPDNSFLHLINAVRITARRTGERGNAARLLWVPFQTKTSADLSASSTAMLDPYVVGFRPQGSLSVPLVPVALLSDRHGTNPDSWEFQVARHGGPDDWRFHHAHKTFEKLGDGIHEMRVTLAGGPSEKGNACLLQLGIDDFSDLAEQAVHGVTTCHLQDWHGEWLLDKHAHQLRVPGTRCAPASGWGPLPGSLAYLQATGTPRVWPLFSRIDENSGMPIVTGFVAARVVSLGQGKGNSLVLILQPCRMSTPTAVTDAAQEGIGGVSIANPYICRLRLVE